MFSQRLAVLGANTQLKALYYAPVQSPVFHVTAGLNARTRTQQILEVSAGRFIHLERSLLLRAIVSGGRCDSNLLSQSLEGFTKVKIFHPHHEGEDVAPDGASAKTSPSLAIWKHVERRCPLLVERTVRFVAAPRAGQWQIPRDDLLDIQPAFDVVNDRHLPPFLPNNSSRMTVDCSVGYPSTLKYIVPGRFRLRLGPLS
jgi:hypothetical protein